MSVRYLGRTPDGRDKWVIDYYPLGRKGKRERPVFIGSEAEARTFHAELRRQHVTDISTIINPKIIDVYPEYMEWVKIHQKPKTYEDKVSSFKYLLQIFAYYPVCKITPTLINQYKTLRTGKARATIKELNYLQAMINWMADHTPPYAASLPFKIEKVPYKAKLPQVPHPQAIEDLLAAISVPPERKNFEEVEKKKALIFLMYESGLRLKEARLIRWELIEWKQDLIYIDETKGDEPRTADLSPRAKKILWPMRQKKGYVFLNPKTGEPYKSLKTMLRGGSIRAGIRPVRHHLFRHAFGTYLLEATGNLRLVQEALGHADIESTTIYTKIVPALRKRGTQEMRDYVKKNYLKKPKKS